MLQKWKCQLAIYGVAFLVSFGVYEYKVQAQANCFQRCKNVHITGAGNAIIRVCWVYDSSATSCWVCGINSPGAGFCVDGDATLTCKDKLTTVVYHGCVSGCTLSCGTATTGY